MENKISGWVYLIKPVGHNVYKIGCTTNLEKRLIQNSKKSNIQMEYIHYFYSENYEHAEQNAQIMFGNKHLANEWYLMTDEDIEKFKRISK